MRLVDNIEKLGCKLCKPKFNQFDNQMEVVKLLNNSKLIISIIISLHFLYIFYNIIIIAFFYRYLIEGGVNLSTMSTKKNK